METDLDKCFEILLNQLFYDGKKLIVEVEEQFVTKNKTIEVSADSRKFSVSFDFPTLHLLLDEFAESVVGLVKSNEEGFLRQIENQSLASYLGLDIPEKYRDLNGYALLTSHEILIVFCESKPTIESIN